MAKARTKEEQSANNSQDLQDAKTFLLILLICIIGFIIVGMLTIVITYTLGLAGIIVPFSTGLILFTVLSLAAQILIPGFHGGNESSTGALRVVVTLIIINLIYFSGEYFGFAYNDSAFTLLSALIILLVPIILSINQFIQEKNSGIVDYWKK